MTGERKMLRLLADSLLRYAKAAATLEDSADKAGAWVHSASCSGACDYACGTVWIGYTTDADGCVTITNLQNAGTLNVELTERVDPGTGVGPLAADSAEQPGEVNLTKLAAASSKMTPGEYAVDSAAGVVVVAPTGAFVCDTYGPLNAIANAAGIVATHNTAPVLIEVARAALLFRTAQAASFAARLQANHDGLHAISYQEERAAADAYDGALAKVTL